MIKTLIMKFFNAVSDFCIQGRQISKDEEVRVKLLVACSFMSILLLPRSYRQYAYLGNLSDIRVWAPLVACGFLAIQPLLYRLTQKVCACAMSIALVGTVLVHFVSVKTGGIFSYSPYVFVLLVSISFLLCGYKIGLAVIFTTSLAALNLAYGFVGFDGYSPDMEQGRDPLPYVASISFISMMIGFAVYGFEIQLVAAKDKADEKSMELERLYWQATKLAASKDAFLSTMSHEFRTPLNGIIGNLDLLDVSKFTEEASEQVSSIRTCSENLLLIINNLLGYNRIASGEVKLDPRQFAPNKIYSECKSILRANPKSRDLEWKFHSNGGVEDTIFADETLFRQLLLNLLANSVKFTEKGFIRVSTFWRGNQNQDFVLFVEDSGIGITEDQIANIFKPFAQADQTITRRYGGTGLGLALCKNIANLHGGEIEVTSKLGKGSCFKVCIPNRYSCGEVGKTESSNQDALYTPAKIHSQFDGLSVLIAEDDAMNRKTIDRIFRKFNILADFAEDGLQAFEMVSNGKSYDLILMDMQMPVLDGVRATVMIREYFAKQDRPSPMIFALTANAMVGDKEKCLESGMRGYLAKPVRVGTIQDLLLEHFSEFNIKNFN